MVYIPSEHIVKVMNQSPVGFWIDKASNEDKGCLLVKIPNHVIKGIYSGKQVELNIQGKQLGQLSFLILVFRVYDDPDTKNHAELIFIFTVAEEYKLFKDMIDGLVFNVHFFDERLMMREFPHHVLATTCSISKAKSNEILGAWVNRHFYTDKVMSISEMNALVSAEFREKGLTVFNIVIPLTFNDFQEMISYEFPAAVGLSISSMEEGSQFEVSIFGSLTPLFPERTFHSPFNKARKELADIICFDTKTICFIQAKALAILGDAERPLGNRIEKLFIAGNKGMPGKAIKQVQGTIRQLRSSNEIFEDINHTKEIFIQNRSASIIHGIILVSEMHPSVDWNRVGEYLLNVSNEADQIFVHAMDFQELQRLVLVVSSSTDFQEILLQRWNAMKIHKNAHVIAEFVHRDNN